MKRPFEWQTRLRHAHGGRRAAGDGFVSLIADAALIVVLSVMNSFRTEVCDRMLSVLAHVEIFSPSGTLPDWGLPARKSLRNTTGCAVAPYVDARAPLTNAGHATSIPTYRRRPSGYSASAS